MIVKGWPGKFIRARLKDLLTPVVQLLGEDFVRFKGTVASQVAFLECRSREVVESAIADLFAKRFERGPDLLEFLRPTGPALPQGTKLPRIVRRM